MPFWLGRLTALQPCCLQVQASQEDKREMGSRLVPILQAGSLEASEVKNTGHHGGPATGIGEHPQTDVWE